jgi:hypothetical protein
LSVLRDGEVDNGLTAFRAWGASTLTCIGEIPQLDVLEARGSAAYFICGPDEPGGAVGSATSQRLRMAVPKIVIHYIMKSYKLSTRLAW